MKDPRYHGIGGPSNGTGPGNAGIMTYRDIVGFNLENNATVVFDEMTVSVYSCAGTDWIGYDDLRSIADKVKFALDSVLGGYIFWAVGFDKNSSISQAGRFYKQSNMPKKNT